MNAEGLKLINVKKPGYELAKVPQETFWRYASPASTLTLNSLSAQASDLTRLQYRDIALPTNDVVSLNLWPTQNATTKEVIIFKLRSKAIPGHGLLQKFIVHAPYGGGIFLQNEEQEFAPPDGYEEGFIFFFGPDMRGTTISTKSFELFYRGTDERTFARVHGEVDLARATISLQARVNTDGSRYVAAEESIFKPPSVSQSLSPLMFGISRQTLLEHHESELRRAHIVADEGNIARTVRIRTPNCQLQTNAYRDQS